MTVTTKEALIAAKFIIFFYFCEMIETTRTSMGYLEEELVELLEEVDVTDVKDLTVFNDDVNTFDHVINTLMKVCKHTAEQAEQCAMIIHYKGKCSVKKGEFRVLKPMQEAICDVGIDARVL